MRKILRWALEFPAILCDRPAFNSSALVASFPFYKLYSVISNHAIGIHLENSRKGEYNIQTLFLNIHK